MDFFFQNKLIPEGIENIICSYISSTKINEDYWIEFYKTYFSQKVLSLIDKEYRLVCFGQHQVCIFCIEQKQNSHLWNGLYTNCYNCNLRIPCLNCYYYNTWNFCGHDLDEFEPISWKNICGLFRNGINFSTFKNYQKKN